MSTIAVIKTGGKQYKVKEGDTIKVEKLEGDAGTAVTFDDVLLVADAKTGEATVGTPQVSGASVAGTITEQGRNNKVTVLKYKPKTRYKKKVGHKQPHTKVTIGKITK